MKQDNRVGGNLQQALEQNNTFNPMEVLKEGFNLTKTTIPSLIGAALVALAIFFVILMLVVQFAVDDFDIENQTTALTILLVQIMVMPPLFAAIHVMGMRHSVGGRTKASDVFNFIKQPFPFILVALLTQIATQLAAGVLPGIIGVLVLGFISITFSMAIPLAAEYQLSPVQAIRCSFLAVLKRFGSFFSVYIALFGLFLLGIFTLGLGLIFVVPMYYNVKGIMYREVFGISVPDNHENSGHPDAGEYRNTSSTSADGNKNSTDNDTWSA